MEIRQKRPDKKMALSIVNAAKKDMEFTLTIKPTESSGSTIIRNIYESFRMLGDALLAAKGIETKGQNHHIISIKELLKLDVQTDRPINLIENLKNLRNNINYYGYSPELVETENAISLGKSCFNPLLKKVLEQINEQHEKKTKRD